MSRHRSPGNGSRDGRRSAKSGRTPAIPHRGAGGVDCAYGYEPADAQLEALRAVLPDEISYQAWIVRDLGIN